jgi:penicillin-binding protein 1B
VNPWPARARARLQSAAARAARALDAIAHRFPAPGPGRTRRAGPLVVALGLLGTLAVALTSLAAYTAVELHRFQRAEARRAVLVYTAGQPLTADVDVRGIDLAGTLARLNYREVRGALTAPGQYRRTPTTWEIWARRVDDRGRAARLRLDVDHEHIVRISRDNEVVAAVALEPEILTSAADRPGEDYRPVRLADVPLTLINAVLAAEDHRFFEHGGLDVHGLLRAAWANLRAGRVAQGGSTITQQLVKNRLLGSRRTYWRKLREAWLAAVIEWRYGKPQILEAYLNEMYLGQRGPLAIRGVGAAARAYFGKELHQLTLGEAALLAGMIRAPNSYSPVLNAERARQRRDVVLARMRDLGRISPAQYEAARREPVRARSAPAPGQLAPYFADQVRQEIEQRFGDDLVNGRGVRVYTTLDPTLQRFAEAAVARGLDHLERARPRLRRADPAERLQAALIALDPATGHIRALVGGRDYQASQFDRALYAHRQPGSAFKPFVYLAALRPRDGAPAFTAASMVDDTPLTLAVNGEPWSPRNYEDRYEGRVTVRRALERSLNAATVRVAETVGLPAVIDAARAVGIVSPLQPVPAMALGAFEVTPIELARAYLPFANQGRLPAATSTLRAVDDGDGTAVPLDVETTTVMSPAEAYLMTALLQGVMTSGTAASAGLTGPVAGKTGTTNDGRDAWFVGYTPSLLTVVWVGFDSGEAHGMSGAEAALPIWADFMRRALAAYPVSSFAVPPGVTVAQIDTTNGKLANRFCPVVAPEVFLSGTEPPPCDEHGGAADHILDWWRRFREWLGR